MENKEELYFIKREDGTEIIASTRDLLNTSLDLFGSTYFKEHYSPRHGFKFLRRDIYAATAAVEPIPGFQHARWINDRFVFKSTDTLHIEKDFLQQKGTLSDWQTKIGNQCNCPALQFGLILGFATPLAKGLNATLFGANLWGRSDIGKTTAVKVANSITQSSDEVEHCQYTMAALQLAIEDNQHKLIIADELTRADKAFMENIGALFWLNSKRRGFWQK